MHLLIVSKKINLYNLELLNHFLYSKVKKSKLSYFYFKLFFFGWSFMLSNYHVEFRSPTLGWDMYNIIWLNYYADELSSCKSPIRLKMITSFVQLYKDKRSVISKVKLHLNFFYNKIDLVYGVKVVILKLVVDKI